LVQIQIVEAATYRDLALKQYQSKVNLPASRGLIYDRNGNVMASNAMDASFAADPTLATDDANAIAAAFAKAFGKPKKYYEDKLNSDSKFVWLERQASADQVKNLNLDKLAGIVVKRNEPKRLYNYDHLAGQLLGFTDIDDKGLAGTELEFDSDLRGADGYVIFQRDGKGRARPVADYPRVEPRNGNSVYLTIDAGIQQIVEEELSQGIEKSKAESGLAIVVDPHTGAILALAQNPPVNPNAISATGVADQRLRAITDLFEPGSVFKIVTTSAAIDDNVISPDQKFYAENGKYNVTLNGKFLRTISDVESYGWVTFKDALAYSSNIVMAKASDIIGPERLYRMARNYGFGMSTDIELPGEVKGVLKRPIEWSATTLNTMAYGYEVAVTPLQLAMAYAALANGGELMKPYIFMKETDEHGAVVRENEPQTIRRVISPQTAATLTGFFEGVVEIGTGKGIKMNNLLLAGKTGTSRKIADGKYKTDSYTASFVGFFPADAPKVVCLVMMDNPHGPSYYGGATSAPVFHNIAQRIMNTTELLAPGPRLSVTAENNGTAGAPLAGSSPMAGAVMRPVSDVSSPRGAEPAAGATALPDTTNPLVPNVTGLTARKAVTILSSEKLSPVVSGSGVVVTQSPLPGSRAIAGMKIMLVCQPKALSSAFVPY
jgi:cell division protein FtsI (penicillin-binding protein 3)